MATLATDTSLDGLLFTTTTLPSQISISVTSLGTDAITTAAAPTAFTIVSLTRQSIVTEAGGAISTTTYVAISIVTDAAQFSSLSSAASASTSSKTQAPSSNSASSSTAALSSKLSSSSSSSSPSLSTIVPAVIVPVLFLLVVLALCCFLLKRRRKSKSHAWYTQDRYDKPELDTTELPRTHGRAELHGRRGAEVLSPGEKYNPIGHVHELPGSVHGIAELEGDASELPAETRRDGRT